MSVAFLFPALLAMVALWAMPLLWAVLVCSGEETKRIERTEDALQQVEQRPCQPGSSNPARSSRQTSSRSGSVAHLAWAVPTIAGASFTGDGTTVDLPCNGTGTLGLRLNALPDSLLLMDGPWALP